MSEIHAGMVEAMNAQREVFLTVDESGEDATDATKGDDDSRGD